MGVDVILGHFCLRGELKLTMRIGSETGDVSGLLRELNSLFAIVAADAKFIYHQGLPLQQTAHVGDLGFGFGLCIAEPGAATVPRITACGSCRGTWVALGRNICDNLRSAFDRRMEMNGWVPFPNLAQKMHTPAFHMTEVIDSRSSRSHD